MNPTHPLHCGIRGFTLFTRTPCFAMKLSEASPPHPWNPELPRFSQAVDHLPAILGMWNKFRSCISLSLSVLRGAGHAESVFTVFPLLPPAGSGRFTCGGGRISVPRAGATRKNVKSKKAVRTDPGEKPTALWAIDTPCGVGIRSNGFLAGFLTSNNVQIMAGRINSCQQPSWKNRYSRYE